MSTGSGRTRTWRRSALVGALALVVSSVVPAVGPSPAGANHAPTSFLQVTPEVTNAPVATAVNLDARLFVGLLQRTPAPVLGTTTINYEIESPSPIAVNTDGGDDDLASPDGSCQIAAGQSTCRLAVLVSPEPATVLVRAWIGDATPDTSEGRLANTEPSESAAADCTSEPGETPRQRCAGGDTPTAGAGSEPDQTDVVRVSWSNFGVDVVPDDETRNTGETATLVATAYDPAGNPAPGVRVSFELFGGSLSDSTANSPGAPDATCTTAEADRPDAGTCRLSYFQGSEGVDLFCVWTSTAPPTMAGTSLGGTCDGEGLNDATANDGKPSPADDDQDVVRVTWRRPPATPSPPPAAGPGGYWMVASDGGIFAFGDASFHGSTGAMRLNQPIVGMASTPTDKGYRLVASDGGIFAFGDASFHGSTGAIRLNQPIVGMASTPSGRGYWLVASDGGIFAFGDAAFQGSTGATRLNQPIVGMASTPSGRGYWLVASDGGIFAFGDAAFHGSTGATRLNQPIVGMASTPSGRGYWLVARDGGIFAFGDASFHGSTGDIRLNQPIVAMSSTSAGKGYWLSASDGGVFAFGDAPFKGSTGNIRLNRPMVGMDGV